MSEEALAQKEGGGPSPQKTEPENGQQTPPESSAGDSAQKKGSSSQVLLKDRYRIYTGRPLPRLDLPHAKAFVAEDTQALEQKIYALVVSPTMIVRADNLKEIGSVKSAGLLELIDYGVIFWPPFSAKTRVLIYQRPLGGKVMEKDDATILPLDEQNLMGNVFPTLFSALEALNAKGLTHRAVRPSNMYWLDAEKQHIVLGDCVSCPPAYEQPCVFESISSGMCMPVGRGKGKMPNDLYSLAVSMIFLALGHDPLAGKKDNDILLMKIQKGSYAALLENETIYMSMIDLLRGLLADTPEQRWDAQMIHQWMAGQKMLRTSQVEKVKSSQRPFLFEGKEYFSYRGLAHAFSLHWNAAAEAIRGEKLLAWLSRGFNDKEMAEKIEQLVQNVAGVYGTKEEQDDYLVIKVCMMLDLQAPLRMRDYRLMPEGLSYMMAIAALEKQDMRPYIDLISEGFLEMWYDVREDRVTRQYIKNFQKILSSRDLGMGVERCLYEMNEALPCLSPMLEKEYIDDVRKILPALDVVSQKADHHTWPLDRHIVAFVAKHFGGKVSQQLYAVNRTKASQATAGMLSLLAMIQWTFGPEVLYGLTTWVGELVTPIIDSYHNKNHRTVLEKELPKYIRKGNLPALYRFLDGQEERDNDTAAFHDAKNSYAAIQKEVDSLENDKDGREKYYINLGYQIASLFSFSVALLSMFFLLLYRFLKG